MFHIMHHRSNVAGKNLQAADKTPAHQASTVERAVHCVQHIRCMRSAFQSHNELTPSNICVIPERSILFKATAMQALC